MDKKPIEAKTDNLIQNLLFNSLSPEELDFCMWALGVVYGWKPEKIKRFKLGTLAYWMSKARKRLTVENLMGIHYYLSQRSQVKEKTLWQKIFKKN